MSLKAEPEWVGKIVRCPGCNTKLQIPELPTEEAPPPDAVSGGAVGGTSASSSTSDPYSKYEKKTPHRAGWKEQDPSNPNGFISAGIGLVLALAWFGIVYPFQAPEGTPVSQFTGMQFLANVFFKHFTISFINTLFFCWSVAILYLKLQKLRHQREALLLDVLPSELGQEINADNVGIFIDHVYNLPHRLRDSFMVNRIRKALELFEVKQSTDDVSHMLDSQSNIDGARIAGSYIILKAFLWAIPLLGFIGTVVGLSHAISGMSFGDVDDVSKIVDSINAVTSGLGTAFDATLLGLVFAVALNFPINSLSKAEDETLNNIDSFCNEVLLPRLNDGAGPADGDPGVLADSLVRAIAGSQREFLVDLNELSKRMNEYATNLDKRSDAFQSVVTKEFINNTTLMRSEMQESLRDNLKQISQYIGALETGIRGLNTVLKELNGQQVVVQQVVKKKGWFSRD